MDIKKVKELLQSYCDELNTCLEKCESRMELSTSFINTFQEMNETVHGDYYWDRTCYIASIFDTNKCWEDLYNNPQEYECVVSDDLSEHPGIVIGFKHDKQY